jgi:hypothetical protein
MRRRVRIRRRVARLAGLWLTLDAWAGERAPLGAVR